MKTIFKFLYLYIALVAVLVGCIGAMVVIQNVSDFPTPWVENTVATLTDLIKVTVGAALGSLGAALVMAIEREKRSDEHQDSSG